MSENDIFLNKWRELVCILLDDLAENGVASRNDVFQLRGLRDYKVSEYLAKFRTLNDLDLWPKCGLKDVFRLFKLSEFERFCLAFGFLFKENRKVRGKVLRVHGSWRNGLLLEFCEEVFEICFKMCGEIQREPLKMRLLGLKRRDGVEVLSVGILLVECVKGLESRDDQPSGVSWFCLRRPVGELFELPVQKELGICLAKIKSFESGNNLLILEGGKFAGKKVQFALLAGKNGMPMFLVDFEIWETFEREELENASLDVCLRVILRNAWVCFEKVGKEVESERAWDVVVGILKRYVCFFSVAVTKDADFLKVVESYTVTRFKLDYLHGKVCESCWKYFLNIYGLHFDAIDVVSRNFLFVVGQIEQVARRMRLLDEANGEVSLPQVLRICQEISGENFGEKAKRMNGAFGWEDLVVTEECKKALEMVCDLVKFSGVVYDELGFGRKMAYGRSTSALFYGAPGTGKTMATQVIANEVGLPLYRIDLSQIISKYIGETEKRLNEIFDIAKRTQVVLFFDEADALFAKRTQVSTSNDRFANVETSFLLQKIEDYSGVVILATNLLSNFDDAFKRRIKIMVNFALPDEEMRLKLWGGVFPKEVDVSRLDFDYLAEKFEVSGSVIKSAALLATFFCVKRNEPLSMEQVFMALKVEMSKSGQLVFDRDFSA
ncbi:MAG: ATP-binding protein [Oscillospiraceae bacterium]|jgi:AAA+ superfamily predicted ATPase|nr:ATP-binding protein [Oscillospiraceae bacterium]